MADQYYVIDVDPGDYDNSNFSGPYSKEELEERLSRGAHGERLEFVPGMPDDPNTRLGLPRRLLIIKGHAVMPAPSARSGDYIPEHVRLSKPKRIVLP